MTTDPDQIRAEINALLAQLPDPNDVTAMTAESEDGPSLADLEQMARRLSEAHDVLLQALESAEKG
jgi:hypothetical protein